MSMFPIASYTFTSDGGGFSFTNVPQVYEHLRIHFVSRGTAGFSGSFLSNYIYFNTNDGANYRHGWNFVGNNAAGSAGGFASSSGTYALYPDSTRAANIFGAGIVDICDYSNTSKFKTAKYFGGTDVNGAGSIMIGEFTYSSLNAITQINISGDGNYAAGSRFDLYGIGKSLDVGS